MSDMEAGLLPNPFDTAKNVSSVHDSTDLEGLVREFDSGQTGNEQPPNFPPFYPLVYHNIGQEIPQKYVYIVRINLITAYSFTASMIFNFLGSFFSTQMESPYFSSAFREIFLAFINLIILPISLFYVQYYPFYKAVRDEGQNRAIVPVQIMVIIIFGLLLIGFPGTGNAGIIYATEAFNYGGYGTKFFSVVMVIWHFVDFVGEIAVLLLSMNSLEGKGRIANPSDI